MTIRYTRDHEWIRLEGDTATIGITDYAQEQLGDIVYVELPEVGQALEKGAEFCVVESVKAASEVFAPIAGTVTAVNSALTDQPGNVNMAPEGDGWLVRITPSDKTEIDGLMDEAAYKAFLETI